MAKKNVMPNMIKIYENPEDAPVYPLGKGVPNIEKLNLKVAQDGTTGEGFSLRGRIWTPNQEGYLEAQKLYEKEQNKISTLTINE